MHVRNMDENAIFVAEKAFLIRSQRNCFISPTLFGKNLKGG